MAPKFPDELDVFVVPHSRMKALVGTYTDELSKTDFRSSDALQSMLGKLAKTFQEFKSHEYIENRYILERLKQRLKMVNISSQAVCNCHGDDRLAEVLKLLQDGYSCTSKSVSDRLRFGLRLQKAVEDFTAKFIPHMEEEEEVFQPLLIKYFEYDELCSLKELVIQQHDLWKKKFIAEQVGTENLLTILSSLASKVVDTFSSDSENSVRQKNSWKRQSPSFNELPEEMILGIFSYLNPLDRSRCARVCKLWNVLIYSPVIWKEVFPTNWSKGLYDFQYHDPYLFVEAELVKKTLLTDLDTDSDEECLLPAAQRQIRLYEQFILFILPRIGDGVRRLVVAGGQFLTSQMLRSMLILCPNLTHLDASLCTKITDATFKGLARHGSCRRLTFLDLSGCRQLTDVGFQRLGDCFHLKTRDAVKFGSHCKSCLSCPASDSNFFDGNYALSYDTSSSGIEHVNLSGCLAITDSGLQSLLDVSLQIGSMRFLDLSGCWLVSGQTLILVASCSPRLQPKDLYYCNMIESGPYQAEANGCQNLSCPLLSCCCSGD